MRGSLVVRPDGIGCGPIWVPFREISRAAVHLVEEVSFIPGLRVVLRIHTLDAVHDFIMKRDVFEQIALPLQPVEVRSKMLPRAAKVIIVLTALTAVIGSVVLQVLLRK